MARMSFNDVNVGGNSKNFDSVKFFKLENDNDEAIVRIMHDSINDFDILTTHTVSEDGRYRGKVSCLRDPREDITKCPLCAANIPVEQRMFIHLIRYYVDAQTGNIVPQAEVWDRSVSYANQIKSYIDNYGPMSDIICKIIRHGKANEKTTRYEIVPNLNKQTYRDDVYVKDTSLFENYTVLGNKVQDRSFEELMEYAQTGHFPQKQTNAPQNTIPMGNNYSQSVPQNNYSNTVPYVNPQVQNTPVEQNTQTFSRPVRTYY